MHTEPRRAVGAVGAAGGRRFAGVVGEHRLPPSNPAVRVVVGSGSVTTLNDKYNSLLLVRTV